MQARRTAIACLTALTLGTTAASAPADARSTVVMCIGSQGELQAYVKPRACTFKVAGKPTVGAYLYRLESLRWRHWGTRRATAKGRFTGNMQYRVRSTVTLSRRSPCGDDRRGYTRFAMTLATLPAKVRIDLDRCPRAARAAQRKVRSFYARGPRGIVGCEMADAPGISTVRVVCQSFRRSRYQNAILDADGAVVWCWMRIPRQNGRCLAGDLGEDTRTYRAGRRITVGRFRCRVLRGGVRCVVIATGKGFVYAPDGVSAIGGATIRHAPPRIDLFESPDRKVFCLIQRDFAVCASKDLLQAGSVSPDGKTTICHDSDACVGVPLHTPSVLRPGQQTELHNVNCRSAADGITCVLVAGEHKGVGFRVNATEAVRVG